MAALPICLAKVIPPDGTGDGTRHCRPSLGGRRPLLGHIFGGVINALAGGGTLLTFPALMAFTSGVTANCTSTLALLPAAMSSSLAYRKELREDRAWLTRLAPVSLVGAAIGGLLVILPNPEHFDRIVPYLALIASVLFTLQPVLAPRLAIPEGASRKPPFGSCVVNS